MDDPSDLDTACGDYERHRESATLATAEGKAAYEHLLGLLANSTDGHHDWRGVRYQYQRHIGDFCRILGVRLSGNYPACKPRGPRGRVAL